MKTNLLIVLLFFALSFSNINAQKFELGKVTVAELEEKEHPKDPSASAAILFKIGETRFDYSDSKGFEIITKVKTRIKIYKKEGYEWANQEVGYYLETSLNEFVSFSDAYTYNLVGGKIEKSKLKSDGEFTEKINKFWGQKKITMPNVKEGSVIEFEYTIRTGYIGSLREWYFQSSIPVNYSEYKTSIPEYYTYNLNQKGYVMLNTNVLKKANQIILHSKERTGSGGFNGPVKTTFSEDKIDFTETQTTYSVKDLPAVKEEAFVNNIDNYTSSISHELSMTKFPNTNIKTYSTDWESVVKTIYNYDDFGSELNKTGYFEDDINKLLTGINIQDERIIAIFNYVKSNVKWNSYKGYSCNDGVKKAYKDKTGNSAEINLMLTAMLRFAGLNANPVLISTRDNGISFFPSRTAFNFVISAVETQDGFVLLDATEKYAEPNILPLRDLNWLGRLIRKDGTSTEVDLMSKKLSIEATNMSVILTADGVAEGQIRRQLGDYEALMFRKQNGDTTKDSYIEKLENNYNNIEISDYVRENELDLALPIIEKYKYKDTKNIEVINGKIYISPMLFLNVNENPFKQEVREYSVDFGYPKLNKHTISIEIPEGYAVESMPSAINVATEENVGTFKYMIVNSGNKIIVTITSTTNQSIVPSNFYSMLKGFFQQMIDKQNEKIVLKKV